MKFYNIKNINEQVNFVQAIQQGLGSDQGLFFPIDLPRFTTCEIDSLLNMDFINRSLHIMSVYIGHEVSENKVLKCINSAFTFPVIVLLIKDNIAVLELFHGPTLAFKDFGGRFMAHFLNEINQGELMTILTATSGDTGAAIAHAFYGFDNVNVIILYPNGKISSAQERLFCTLGGNVYTLAVDGDFDACQLLVKQAFDNTYLRKKLGLNSANSINIGRLLPQICYYFEAFAQLFKQQINQRIVISVPSGNFGNLTAGLLAKSLGLPVKRFIVATNINNTVPRYLSSGYWFPQPAITTLSNAMDVSYPNNWARIEELFRRKRWQLSTLSYGSVDDDRTIKTLQVMADLGYISEPHAAVSYCLLSDQLHHDEFGIFLGTAHPAKFKHEIESIFNHNFSLLSPASLLCFNKLPLLSRKISVDFNELRNFMLSLMN
ncbi:threonine synthase [Blochmannia endosymbiont of Camponotus (Colobopsis) obliquus]|uniref:threonine synthase n=1 Tax=Blochmannia endosymbiont of Camponotus (Colobopsis) obliquus TaxID=1505597 RepID=UPI00061A7966|nr:threonine synthase [Blochmannia endosymbiont of Camponotus (Colobopsis) obliquus]AKC60290.1 threonine synthase [Blochmannia endosymbiont of Camponotus (Colobopsis) obliquus]